MKSYIHTLADYREAPFEKNIYISCPEEYLQSQIRHVTRKYKRIEPVQKVQMGDTVVLSLKSSLEKYNRSCVPITIGGKLSFDPELEQQLCGHETHEVFPVQVQSQEVLVTILQANRTIFPEPTDAMVQEYAAANEEFQDVTTVEEYIRRRKNQYFEEERQKVVYQIMDEITGYVLTHSDWEFEEEELQEQLKQAKAEMQESLKEEGKSLETLTEAELQMYFGVDTSEEVEDVLRSGVEQNIAIDLWLQKENKTEDLDTMQGNPWDFLQSYVEESITIKEER